MDRFHRQLKSVSDWKRLVLSRLPRAISLDLRVFKAQFEKLLNQVIFEDPSKGPTMLFSSVLGKVYFWLIYKF